MTNSAATLVRPSAVAGAFYPAAPAELAAQVEGLLGAAKAAGPRRPKALIAPHAGYIYSGPTAAAAYAALAAHRDTYRRVVLLGPAHRVRLRGFALPASTAFATPLGTVPLDREAVELLRKSPLVCVSEEAHALEHSLEVHLPFLQKTLGAFTLVPLAVGTASPQEVAQLLDALWGGDETLIVVSSDLSHYLPYAQASTIDYRTTGMILSMMPQLNHEQACGATPVNGLLQAAARRGLQPAMLDLCNSGDTAGDKNRVVGYASFAFYPQSQGTSGNATGDKVDGNALVSLARAAIEAQLGLRAGIGATDAAFLRKPAATFVTLKQQGRLRGCIGSLSVHRPLIDDVRENAIAAAFRDPRFKPLVPEELDSVQVEVSLLSPLQPMAFRDEADLLAQLRPGIDGLVLEHGGHRGTFLPQVWETLPEPNRFLAELKRKAGLAADFWAGDVRVSRYTVAKWAEPDDR